MALARWQRTIVDQAGNIRPGAMIEVRLEATGNLAALKNNRSGSEGKANPFAADGNGFAFFYAVGGAYRITATDGEALLGEWRDEAVGTAAETDAPVGITRIHTEAGDAEIMAADQCLIIDKDVGESTTVHIPAAAERNGVDIIIKDGKGDADINNITPSFDGAETCDGLSGDDLKITTKRGVLWMRPKPDGSGYIQIDPLDDTLKALGALDETVGILVQIGEDAFERRTLTGTENEVDVVDGAGAGGDPIISLASTLILTGKAVTVDTQDQSDDSTKVASTGYVRAAINAVLDGVSSSFDTLAEIASELALKAYASVTLTAGGGLTGGGDLSTNRTLNVGAGTGITVNANDVALAAIADDRIMANVSGGSAAPSANTLTSILDEILGNTRGAIVTRNASAWVKLDPGTSGHFLRSNGAAADISYGAVPGGGDLLSTNNLSDVADADESRANLIAAPMLSGLATGMQPYRYTPNTMFGITKGSWSNTTGTVNIASPTDLYCDFTTATPDLDANPAVGAFISGTLSAAGTTTDNTEVCFYLCHRNSDKKPFFVATGSGIIAHTQPLSFTAPYTATNATPCVFTTTSLAHGLRKHQAVFLETGAPTGFSTLTPYYVCTTPSSSTFTLSSSIANAKAGTQIASSSTGAGNLSWGVQRELDHRLGAGVATADRRYPYFAFVWSVNRYGAGTGIPNLFNSVGSARTILTSMDTGASPYRILNNGVATSFTTIPLGITGSSDGFLHDGNRLVHLYVQVSSSSGNGTAYIKSPSIGSNGIPVGTVTSTSTFAYGEFLLRTNSVNEIEYRVQGNAQLSLWIRGWEFSDT